MPQVLCITPNGMAAPDPDMSLSCWEVDSGKGVWEREGRLGEGREMSCLSFSLISLLFPHLPSFLRSQPRKPSSSRPRRVDIPLGVPQRPLGFSPTLYPTSLQIGTNSLEEKEENVSKQ